MAAVVPKTVGESLYWSYANLAMAFTSAAHGKPDYQQTDFIVRSRLYYGLLRGKLQLGSLVIDEKEKLSSAGHCCYCASRANLTIDHLIPQFKGGEHDADNLVPACRSCNSTKRALDLLEWMAKRDEFPPLALLRRYLKLAIRYCVEKKLMEVPLEGLAGIPNSPLPLFDSRNEPDAVPIDSTDSRDWPFAIWLIPHYYPDPPDLIARAWPDDDEDEIEAP